MTIQQSHFDAIIEHALDAKIATAISLYVARGTEKITLHRGDVDEGSLYDLASLTKILGTTIALAYALMRQKITRSEKPFLCWPEVTVSSLMNHTSGLAAHVKFYQLAGISERDFKANKKIIFDELFLQKQIHPAGLKREYSDLNFLALEHLLESRFNRPLWEIFNEAWRYFALQPLTYSPSAKPPLLDAVPTSKSRAGYVHDDNCYFLGGLAGHAGLFGSLADVASYGEFFSRVAKNAQTPGEAVLSYCMKHHLGFAAPTPRGSIRALSPYSCGHFGFTGTSLWVDPARDLKVVLLTNRVFCSLDGTPIFALRERIHNAAVGNG